MNSLKIKRKKLVPFIVMICFVTILFSPLIVLDVFAVQLGTLSIVGIVLFSACIIFICINTLIFKRYGLIIDQDGITDNSTIFASSGLVKWDNIIGIDTDEKSFKDKLVNIGDDIHKKTHSLQDAVLDIGVNDLTQTIGDVKKNISTEISGATTDVISKYSNRYILINIKNADDIIRQNNIINRFFLKSHFQSFGTPFIIDAGTLSGILKDELIDKIKNIINNRQNINL